MNPEQSKLTPIRKLHGTYYTFQCSCGKTTKARMDKVQNGQRKSCGCINKDRCSKGIHRVHNMSKTKFMNIFRGILQRTTNKDSPKYKSYGARGIKSEWKNFQTFYNDMYPSYLEHSDIYGESDTSIERINNNGNYCKNNCKWIRNAEQAINRRNNHFVSWKGEKVTVGQFEKELGICRGLVRYQTNKGLSTKEIIKLYNKKYARQ